MIYDKIFDRIYDMVYDINEIQRPAQKLVDLNCCSKDIKAKISLVQEHASQAKEIISSLGKVIKEVVEDSV